MGVVKFSCMRKFDGQTFNSTTRSSGEQVQERDTTLLRLPSKMLLSQPLYLIR